MESLWGSSEGTLLLLVLSPPSPALTVPLCPHRLSACVLSLPCPVWHVPLLPCDPRAGQFGQSGEAKIRTVWRPQNGRHQRRQAAPAALPASLTQGFAFVCVCVLDSALACK